MIINDRQEINMHKKTYYSLVGVTLLMKANGNNSMIANDFR